MTLQVGFLVFPRVQQLDLTGPYEVFSSTPSVGGIHLIWRDKEPVTSSTGLTFQPTTSFQEVPALDLLCVPGGIGVNALLADEEVTGFLRRQAEKTRYITSVCTGSLVLGAAGLLKGRRATSHWMARDLLAKFGAVPTEGRVVRDGNVITAGGVTAGIDFGLTVLSELVSPEAAQTTQLYMEYAPAPPFEAGTPETAPKAVVETARQRGAASRKEREAIIAGLVGRQFEQEG